MKLKTREAGNRTGRLAFTLAEALVSVLVLGILATGIAGAFSSGLGVVDAERKNLRATQIMMQKAEAIRLLTWSQGTNTSLAPTNFTAFYDPSGTSEGTVYAGYFSESAAPTNIPAAYASQMRLVTITLFWTNYPGHGRPGMVESRQMQTLVAHYGIQNYVYK